MDELIRDAIRELDYLAYVVDDTATTLAKFSAALDNLHDIGNLDDATLPEDVYELN